MTLISGVLSDYATTDTAIAAYLQSEGFTLTDVDASNPRHCIFHFQNDNPKLSEFVHNFEIGQALGNIATFFFCYKRLLVRVKVGV